jgi:hypothetical protein
MALVAVLLDPSSLDLEVCFSAFGDRGEFFSIFPILLRFLEACEELVSVAAKWPLVEEGDDIVTVGLVVPSNDFLDAPFFPLPFPGGRLGPLRLRGIFNYFQRLYSLDSLFSTEC